MKIKIFAALTLFALQIWIVKISWNYLFDKITYLQAINVFLIGSMMVVGGFTIVSLVEYFSEEKKK